MDVDLAAPGGFSGTLRYGALTVEAELDNEPDGVNNAALSSFAESDSFTVSPSARFSLSGLDFREEAADPAGIAALSGNRWKYKNSDVESRFRVHGPSAVSSVEERYEDGYAKIQKVFCK